jgi:hypothetical protein
MFRSSSLGAASLGLFVAAIAAPTPAAAEAPEVTSKVSTKVTPKGEVVATMRLAAKPAAIREVLGSAERSHGLAPTTVSAKATPDGSCERVKLRTRGLLQPFEVETRRCPTAHGWKETLVSSPNFVEYWNEWVIEETPAGTNITFRTKTVPNVVGVPEVLIQTETKRVLSRLLHNLQAAVGE